MAPSPLPSPAQQHHHHHHHHEQIIYDKEGFLDKVYRRGKSQKSKASAKVAIGHFDNFCMERFTASDIEVINRLKEGGRLDLYKVLDSFVGWMVSKGLKPTSISPYISFVKNWLEYCDIEISESQFKRKVTMPRIEVDETLQEGPSFEDIHRILSILPPTLRLLCMLILTSLRRPSELLQLRVRDIDFDHTPTMIKIVARNSKNRIGRESFVTSEVSKMLRDHIKRNHLAHDAYLFKYAEANGKLSIAEHSLRYHIKRYLPDLDTKIEGTNRHKFTLYSFKDFGFTKAEKLHGTAFAKYLKGDKKNPYSNLPLEERQKMYLELEPELTVLDPSSGHRAREEEKNLQSLVVSLEKRLADSEKLFAEKIDLAIKAHPVMRFLFREGSSKEFMEMLEKQAPELISKGG